ncbi:MAG: hypothetical protein RMJ56_03190 [Gemmataceae bacterium]|nr:hypothetical protein [Gemmata sp.]MDW8196593.1 hypothetical protein [Gemmataceae bacterium]
MSRGLIVICSGLLPLLVWQTGGANEPGVAGPVAPLAQRPPALPADGDRNYQPPPADGAVVELADESLDQFLPVLHNDFSHEVGQAVREDRDVFAGVEAAKVVPMQRYRSTIPGWKFSIVEKPARAGEFRYLRFAWKKNGGTGIMIQFHDLHKTWAMRYHAGRNVFNWEPSKSVAAQLPGDWELVTRDLFADYGAFVLTGMALSPLDGQFALFDHVLLGRSRDDLDKATDAALGRIRLEKIPTGPEREQLWAQLMGANRVQAAAAQRQFLASATSHVEFIREQLTRSDVNTELLKTIQQLIQDLDADDFNVRDRATDALIRLGDAAVDAVQSLVTNAPNDEVHYRAQLILRKLKVNGSAVSEAGKKVRAVRILERAATAEAKALLEKIAAGEYGFDIAADAKAALQRLQKRP